MRRLALATSLLALASCSSAPPFDAIAVVKEWAEFMNRDHMLIPGDELTITVGDVTNLTQTVVVSAEGTVSLRQLPDSVRAVGRTVRQFREAAQEAYRKVNLEDIVSVNLTKPSTHSIYVAGEVRDPGALPWTSSMTMAKAVAAAGGFQITAKDTDVFLVRPEPQTGRQRMVRVNVWAILEGEQPDFPLLPGDVVWAQTSGIADVGNWVELYIRRLLPFQVNGFAVGSNN